MITGSVICNIIRNEDYKEKANSIQSQIIPK